MHDHPLLARAKLLLRAGQPLPLDLFAHLIEAGIDVDALETTYPPEFRYPPDDWYEFLGPRSGWPRPNPYDETESNDT